MPTHPRVSLSPRRAAALAALAVAALAGVSAARESAAAPAVFSGSELSVQGEYLKPEIVVIMNRENLNKAYDLTLDEDFLARIVSSVQADPF